MTVLVTGAAGFIGMSLSMALLDRGEQVIGLDEMNAYYDIRLKQARRDRLLARDGFSFERLDIADGPALADFFARHPAIDRIVHLAAQAGVRHSLTHPQDYARSNLTGHLNMLEQARALRGLRHMVYASSSSVYGGERTQPFSVDARCDRPVSLYAASKRANEMMGHAYAHLYRIPQTGLRFFTVYGPWGRPDMALFIFTRAMLAGQPLPVFNHGDMKRDFTYIDDIVGGILSCLDAPPADDGETPPHRVYNIGNNRPEPLMRLITLLEQELGRKAVLDFQPIQPGDVRETCADIEPMRRDFGYSPATSIDQGVPAFVRWYKSFYPF